MSNEVLGDSRLSSGVQMAAKKKAKSRTQVATKAKAAGKKVATKAKAAGKKVATKAKVAGKKVATRAKAAGKKVAKTFLGRLAQRSAQLVIDSGLLGDVPPERARAKKRARNG
jgi:hypothetical protein